MLEDRRRPDHVQVRVLLTRERGRRQILRRRAGADGVGVVLAEPGDGAADRRGDDRQGPASLRPSVGSRRSASRSPPDRPGPTPRQSIELIVDRGRRGDDPPERRRRHAEPRWHAGCPRSVTAPPGWRPCRRRRRPVPGRSPGAPGRSSSCSRLSPHPLPCRRAGGRRDGGSGRLTRRWPGWATRTSSILSTKKVLAASPHPWATLRVAGEGAFVRGGSRALIGGRPLRCPPMCLLVVISGVVPGMPLIVAANRDERRARPAIPMTRLDGAGGLAHPRRARRGRRWHVVGDQRGRCRRRADQSAVARRSRRGQAIRAASCPSPSPAHPTAAAAVEAFGTAIDPGAYNPSWLLVADRHDAFFVDVTATDEVLIEHLQPGVHVLENRDLHEPSPKADRVRELLESSPRRPARGAARASCRRCSPTT